jgi:putative flippase GtrA
MAHVHSAIPFAKAESRLRGLSSTLRRLAGPLEAFSRTPLGRAFLRFLGVGVVGLAVDASIFALLDAVHVAPEWSRAASLAVATLVTWRLNRRHTFGASGRALHVEALRYGAVTLVAQGFSYSVFLLLVYELPVLPRIASLLVGAGLAAIAGFAGHKLFAFAPARRTPA